ncbi:hypothetical protein L1887_29217 [Cichorium endivia]|nr:hypothetical protein L1887_29217 [Cichorium endivia]
MTGTVDMSTAQAISPSYVNSFRISAVTSRLNAHLRGDKNIDITEFFNLCLSLARGIDYAVANNEVPSGAPELPNLIKQVCQQKNEPQLQAAIMVLMISIKSACSNGWFCEKEKEELHVLSDEMQSSFCSVNVKDMNSNMKNKEVIYNTTISTIISKFYPGMKMGEILCLLEATPGYDSYVTDLNISKSARSSTSDKIYLFVAQIDNIETSSCIISPQQVNFLLNGEGVEKRTCIFRDPVPQNPTPVTHMLKYGSNLLQAVGQFNGRYIIVIAFMSVLSNPICPPIQDYVPPSIAAPDPDNEIIEGPSRISLKCPISFSRIKIPVKGHTCKHLQCFDLNNYVGINTRRPQWRCPHCSQSVSFHDIRIDKSMVKVLKEVGEDVSYVKISSDGSWEAVAESNENTEKQPNDTSPVNQETTIHNVDDIMDLTEGDNNEVDTTIKDNEKKPSVNNVHKNIAPHMEDGFWREFYSSTLPARINNMRPDGDVAPPRDLSRENSFNRNNHVFNSIGQSQSQMSVQNDNLNSRYPTHVLNVSRASNAVQALPAQTPTRTVDVDRHQNFSRQYNQLQAARMSSLGHRDHALLSSQVPPQQMSGGRHTSPIPPDRFRSHQPQSMNQRTPVRPSTPTTPLVRQGGVGPITNQNHYSMADLHRAAQAMSFPPAIPAPIYTSGSPVPVASTADQRDPVDTSVDANWRPTGRMRGSLSGRAYSEALSQFIIQPNQPVQAARPPVLNTPRPFIPPHLQALMANNLRPQGGGNGPDSDGGNAMAGGGGGGGILPDE